MSDINTTTAQSWTAGPTAEFLTNIVSPDISVAVWKRENDPVVAKYFEETFDTLGVGVRRVFAVNELKESLSHVLPDGQGKQAAIDDIYLLSDMITLLFDCDSVGLRLVPLTSAMCPKFHVDHIPVRLVNTYLGDGTEWLPNESLLASLPNETQGTEPQTKIKTAVQKGYCKTDEIKQLGAFDVALLKGSAWDESKKERAAIHRSCHNTNDQKRVLLTLDPL